MKIGIDTRGLGMVELEKVEEICKFLSIIIDGEFKIIVGKYVEIIKNWSDLSDERIFIKSRSKNDTRRI